MSNPLTNGATWTPDLLWWPNGPFDPTRQNRMARAVRLIGARLESGEWCRQGQLVNYVQRHSGLSRPTAKRLIRELIRNREIDSRGDCLYGDTRQVRRPAVVT